MGERKHSGMAVFDHSRFCISAFIIALLIFCFVLSPLNPGSAALAAPITGSGNGSEQKGLTAKGVGEYTVEVNFYNYDDDSLATPIAYDGSDSFYGYVEVTDNATGKVYWSYAPLAADGVTWKASLQNFWSAEDDPRGTGTASYIYDSDSCTFRSSRLYVEPPSYYSVHPESHPDDPDTEEPNDTVAGYRFRGNDTTTDPNKSSIKIQKLQYEKQFMVNLDFIPGFSTSISPDNLYYLFITVDHQTTDDTYQLIPLVTDGTDPQSFRISQWLDNNGQVKQNEQFTGGEQGVTVKILEASGPINMNNAIAGTNCVAIAEGSQVLDYRVGYDSSWSSGIPDPVHNPASEKDEYIYTISLSKIDATEDYTFKSILGPGLYYGITAERFDQGNHIQSNFATNYYDGHNNIVEADLAQSSGAIIMSDSQAYDGHSINIGQSHSGNVIIYTNKDENGLLTNPRDFVHVVTSDKDDLKNNYVDPIINYGTAMSNQLISHDPTIIPDVGGGKVLIDTTAFPDDATIYIDADELAAQNKLSGGNLLIKKDPNQLLVFNFDSTTELRLGEFYVQYPDMSEFADGVAQTLDGYSGKWIKSDTPTTQGPKNDALDIITRHIVWNCNSVTELELGMTAGMFLVPDITSYTDTAQTSSGWIITGGTFHNSGGEWHFNYQDLEDIDEASLTAKKTVEGAVPTAAEKFLFTVERYNKAAGTWEEIASIENNGSAISYTVNEENETLELGWNAYRIRETAVSGNNTSDNIYDTSFFETVEYYAAVNYRELPSTVRVASIPKYYSGFDGSAFQTGASYDIDPLNNGFSALTPALTFDNKVSSIGANLQVTKLLEGIDWGDAGEFTFTLTPKSAKDSNDQDITPIPMPSDETPETATATAENKTAVFGVIQYEHPGTYVYTIKENVPEGAEISEDGTSAVKDNITYDLTEYEVTVTVEENEEGKLEASVDYGSGAKRLFVTNTFEFAEEVSDQLEATKEVLGRKAPAEAFTFVLTPFNDNARNAAMVSFAEGVEGDATAPQQITVSGAAAGNPVTGEFKEIFYSEPGEYVYRITEIPGNTDKFTYDGSIYEVTVTVRKDGTTEKTIKKVDSEGNVLEEGLSNVVFVNEYDELDVVKKWNGTSGETTVYYRLIQIATPKPAETKTVTLKKGTDQNNLVTETQNLEIGTIVKITANHPNQWNPPAVRTYPPEGNFYYLYTEIARDETESTSDQWVFYVTITSDIDIEAHTATGANDISYIWTEQSGSGDPTEHPYPDETKIYSLTSDGDWYDSFTIVPSEAEAAGDDHKLPLEGANATYTYKVVEVDAAGTEITGDVTYTNNDGILRGEISIINSTSEYDAEGFFSLEGTKKVENGDDATEERTFTFTLRYKGDTTSDPVMTGSVTLTDGADPADIVFDPAQIDLDLAVLAQLVADGKATHPSDTTWTIIYTLTEDDPTGTYDDIQPNTQSFDITVAVTDNGDGTLTCTPDKTKAQIAFVNNERGNAKISVSGGKQLEGRTLNDGEGETDKWTFTITAVDGGPMPNPAAVENTNGTFSFGDIVFTPDYLGPCSYVSGVYTCEPKTYLYRVTESGSIPGVTNQNPAAQRFTVTVSLDADGNVKAAANPSDLGTLLTFKNKYNASGSVVLGGTKEVEDEDGNTDESRSFTFELRYAGEDTILETRTISLNDGSTADFSFTALNYSLESLAQLVTAGRATPTTVEEKPAWTIGYTVKERATSDKGMKPNNQTFNVTVTVVDEGNGTLTCTASPAQTDVAFVNTERDDLEVSLQGHKSIPERDLTAADVWTFVITSSTNSPLPSPATVQNTNQDYSFNPITFTPQDIGTHRYTIIETGTVEGVTNATAAKNFTITVMVDNDPASANYGELKYTTDPEDLDSYLTFINHDYGDDKVLGVKKTVKDKWGHVMERWPAGTPSFTFRLTGVNDSDKAKLGGEGWVEAVSTEANPTAKFPIAFTEEDVANSPFSFTITEIAPCDAADHVCSGVTYSTDEIPVEITVNLNDDMTIGLVIKAGENKTIIPELNEIYTVGEYANTYTVTECTFDLAGYKEITDADGADEERNFTFELRYADAAAGSAALYTKNLTIKDGERKTFAFDEIPAFNRQVLYDLVNARHATRSSVNGLLTWTIPYKLTEKASTDKAMKPNSQTFDVTLTVTDDGEGHLSCTYVPESASLEFINNERNDVKVSISGSKNIPERGLTESDKWTFTISADPDTPTAPLPDPASVQNNLGTFSFGDITFTPQHLGDGGADKTYKYIVTETGTVANVTNTTGNKTFTVTVSTDANGNLTAVTDPTDLISRLTFINHYYEDGTMVLGARKSMNPWPTGTTSFNFKLTGTNPAAVAKIGETGYTAEATEANPTAKFGAITFTKSDLDRQPFTFRIKEEIPCESEDHVCKGVTYTTEPYDISVTLVHDETNGKIVPTVTRGGATIPLENNIYTVGTFTNTYDTAEGTFTLKASKKVNDADSKAEDRNFSFELRYATAAAGSAALETVNLPIKDGETKEFSFTEFEYTRESLALLVGQNRASRKTVDGKLTWVIPYVITETATTDKAIKPNNQSFTVMVTVQDDGEGNLVCTASPASSELVFENDERNDAVVAVAGTKSIPERALKAGDEWTFTISSTTDGAPMPAETSVINDTNGDFSFGNITFTPQHLGDNSSSKTYRYKVVETGTVDHVSNTTGEKEFTVTVSVNPSTGNLRAVSDPANLGSLLDFTNHYFEDGTVVFGARKVMETWPVRNPALEFTFRLTGMTDASKAKIGGDSITAKATQANPTARFTPVLTFTLDDLADSPFVYTVEEVNPCAPETVCEGVTYSDVKYAVLVELQHNEETGEIIPLITANGTVIEEENEIYTVGPFKNNYDTNAVSIALEASKQVKDADGNTGERRSFTFELRYADAAADSEPLATRTIAINDGETQDFAFDEFTYDREILKQLVDNDHATRTTTDGKLTWTIPYKLTEKATDDLEMKPNSQTFDVTVTVIDDGKGNLSCSASPAKSSLAFVNEEQANVEIQVAGTKAIPEREMTDTDKWIFTITSNDDGAPMPPRTSVQNNTDGTYSFGTITFTPNDLGENGAQKVYTYKVTETGSVDGVVNMTGEKTFTVTVSIDPSSQEFRAVPNPVTGQLGSLLTFTNHYYEAGSVVLSAVKNMENWPSGTPEFTFILTGTNDPGKAKIAEIAGEGVTELKAKATKDEPIALFNAFTFNSTDLGNTFTFTVKEEVPSTNPLDGVTYSDKEYPVEITLTLNTSTGKIIPTVKVDGTEIPLKDNAYKVGDFTNTYTAAETEWTLEGSKMVNDVDDKAEERSFNFELRYKSADANADPVATAELTIKDGESDVFTFDPITYDMETLADMVEAGTAVPSTVNGKSTWTIEYVLKEAAPADNGLKPNSQSFDITVTVTDDGKGSLSCSSTPAKASILFVNNERGDKKISVTGGKELTGRALKDTDKWTFTITSDTPGAPMPAETSVQNNRGTFTFGDITFTPDHLGANGAQKIYTYKVTESGSVDGVDNDVNAEKSFTVTVSVDTANNNLKLTSDPENLGELLTFTNAYHQTGSLVLGAAKSMGDTPWPSGTPSFTFKLTGENDIAIAKVGEDGITKEATSASPKAVFDAISFTEADTAQTEPFIFKITEVVPTDKKGVTYATEPFIAEVTLNDDGEGHIIPVVKVDGKEIDPENDVFIVGTFENAYNAEGSFSIGATKEVKDADGDTSESRTMNFTLRYKDDTTSDPVMTGTVTLNDGETEDITFSPEKIELDLKDLDALVKAGKAAPDNSGSKTKWMILYTLTEDASDDADLKPNTQSFDITVTVTDEGDGRLTCTVSPEEVAVAFVNNERKNTEVQVSGGKELEGRNLTEEDQWTFTITVEDGGPLPDPAVVKNSTGLFEFSKIIFTPEHLGEDGAEKTYTYTVTESGTVTGVDNDPEASKSFKVTVSLDSNGDVKAVTDPEVLPEVLTFTNTYTANGQLVLRSSKYIVDADGNKSESHTIPFELWYKGDHDAYYIDGDTTVKPFISEDVTIIDGSTTEFTYPLVFTLESPADPAQTPEGAIRVSLPELKEAGKATEKIVDGKSTWTIEYVLDEKTVIDQQLKPPDQTFDVVVTLTDDGAGNLEVTSVKEKNINHPEEAFVEIDPAGDEFSVGQFENKERLDSAPVVFGGVKQLEGRELTEDDTWTFTIEAVDGGPLPDPATATNKKGTFTFAPMVFSAQHLGDCYYTDDGSYHCASKEYTYRVVESGKVSGVTNDDPKTFKVTVSLDDNGDVQAEADPANLGELVTFTNKYNAAGDIQFTARKTLNGGNLTAGQFTFVLTMPDGTTKTASNDAKGLVTFSMISYTLDDAGKTYTYKVQEVIPEKADPDITYDKTVHTVTISLENDGRGNLSKTVTVDGRQVSADNGTVSVGEFINDSTESSDEVRVRLGGTKTLKHWKKTELPHFNFLLFEDGKEIARTSTEGSGTYSFYMTYDKPGTHVYTIREEAGDNKDVIYDTREYSVTVTVTADPAGNLSAEVTGDDPEKLDFVNKGRIVRTGFSAIRPTVLPDMPLDLSYKPMHLTLQIPSLELTTEIVNVPEVDGEHPVTWLGDNAGLLEGYGLPGDGRMYLAGHNHLSDTEAGPFAFLMWMEEGDRIFVTDQNNDLRLYAVYANEKIAEDDIDGLDQISQQYENSITLITCEDEYEPGHYLSRRIIAARPL